MATVKYKYKKSITERLIDSRIIYITGEIDDRLAQEVTSILLYLYAEDRSKDITIYINSPGGSITSGYAIRDVMNFIDCDIKTICIGLAASMGSFLLASGTKGKRYILPNADVMIHQPLGGTGQAQATDITIAAKRINYLKDKMIEQYHEMTGTDKEIIANDVERDHWLTAEEAKEYGIVDHVISSIADCSDGKEIKSGDLSDDDYDLILNGGKTDVDADDDENDEPSILDTPIGDDDDEDDGSDNDENI